MGYETEISDSLQPANHINDIDGFNRSEIDDISASNAESSDTMSGDTNQKTAVTSSQNTSSQSSENNSSVNNSSSLGNQSTGYISKSDKTVEPTRKISDILSSLSESDKVCDSYNLEKYIKPYWKGNIVYNESVCFYKNASTGVASAPLLYKSDKILSVKNAALNKTYTEGVDYTFENGVLTLTENSSIPCFKYGDLYFKTEKSGSSFPLIKGGYSLFREGTYFHNMQVAVTYVHEDPWTGYKPAYQGELIPNVISKLQNGESVSIVYLGDSITKGGNASGMFNAEPNMPIWNEMVTAALKKAYPKAKISAYSASENGATTVQALKNLRSLCSSKNPDLVIIGFGMNDVSDSELTPERFQSNIKNIMQTNDALIGKECDYILLSTSLPNPEIVLGNASYQKQYAAKLYELERAGKKNGNVGEGGVVVGDMTEIHSYLLSKKRFIDMTGNNVNHPNDFLVRAYAQLVTTMLIK